MQPLGQLWSCSRETSVRRSLNSANSLAKEFWESYLIDNVSMISGLSFSGDGSMGEL